MIVTEVLAIRQPFWIPKLSPLLHFNQVFALSKVESIRTEEFSELFRIHGGHLE